MKNGTSYLANPLFEDKDQPATLYCKNDESSTYVLLNQSKRSTTFKVPFGNTVYAEYDWYYPASFAGKTMDVYAVGDIYADGKEHPINKKCGTIDFPSVELTAYSLNLSTDKSMKGFCNCRSAPFAPSITYMLNTSRSLKPMAWKNRKCWSLRTIRR